MDGSGGLPPPHLNYGILQKRLAFRQEESVSVAATLKAIGPPRIPPRRLHCHRGASVVTARNAAPAWMRVEGIWAADVGVFRERRHRGRHMATPRITNAHRGWRGVRSSSILGVEDILLPRWMSSRSAQIPVIGTHTHCSSLQRRARMTGCAARCRVARQWGSRYHRYLSRLGQSGCKRCGTPRLFLSLVYRH